ncbi:hypothetical protein [Leucobacter luti]|uniref:hypothetical protein n=1 Tax=Leucobacter luti TaxID=340320 RepID=UPI001300250D|nr:hypothetical protein [Leucobacter luti]
MDTPVETEAVNPAAQGWSKRRKRLVAGATAAAVALAAGGLAAAWATGIFGSAGAAGVSSPAMKYDIQVSEGGTDFVNPTREEPLVLTSASTAEDLIRSGMEWTVVVRNDGTDSGELFFVICDPSSAKVKYRVAPGKDEEYPDLFTQLRFTVVDEEGTVVIDNEVLGADADNEPNGDGTLRGSIPRVLAAGGGEAEFTVTAVFDFDANDLTRTKLAAYNGVSTDFGIRIEGESF